MGNETDTGEAEGEWTATIETPIDRETLAQGPTTDVAFDLLSHSRRRFVLYCLHSHEGGIDLHRLADHVMRLSEESSAHSVPDYDRLLTRLAHVTLPQLADAGVVVHDRDVDIIWPTEAIAGMGPLLELSATLDFESALPSL